MRFAQFGLDLDSKSNAAALEETAKQLRELAYQLDRLARLKEPTTQIKLKNPQGKIVGEFLLEAA